MSCAHLTTTQAALESVRKDEDRHGRYLTDAAIALLLPSGLAKGRLPYQPCPRR